MFFNLNLNEEDVLDIPESKINEYILDYVSKFNKREVNLSNNVVLDLISDVNNMPELVKSSLDRIKNFVNSVDLNHPDILTLFNGLFDPNNETCKSLIMFFKTIKILHKNNFNEGVEFVDHLLKSSNLSLRKFLETINSPKNLPGFYGIRMLKNSDEIDLIRKTDTIKEFCSPFNEDDSFYQSSPSSFNFFAIGNEVYDLYKQQLIIMNQECEIEEDPYMASNLKQNLEYIENIKSVDFFGFREMYFKDNMKEFIIPTIMFKSLSTLNMLTSQGNLLLFINNFGLGNYFNNKIKIPYTLLFVPLPLVKEKLSNKFDNFYQKFENNEVNNYKPMFDNYYIVLPTIDFSKYFYINKIEKDYFKLMDNREIFNNKSKNFDQEKIDFALAAINNDIYSGLFIGQKDRKIYFLSYLNKDFVTQEKK